MVMLPEGVEVKVDSRGLCEYVDVHLCKDSVLTANILFVDVQYNVRSQVHVTKEQDIYSGHHFDLVIPAPKKVELAIRSIDLAEEFKAKYIRELEIKDELRQMKYSIKLIRTRQYGKVFVTSQMGFVEIKVILTDLADEEIAFEWFQEIANIIESLVQFDERALPYVLVYLDEKITDKMRDENKAELEILLRSSVALPKSSKKVLDILKEQKRKIFPKLSPSDFTDYRNIIINCLNNTSECLLDIYEKMRRHIHFYLFLSAVRDLTQNALLNLEKLEFYTIEEPKNSALEET